MWKVAVLFLALIAPAMAVDLEAGWINQYKTMTHVRTGAPVTEEWVEARCNEAWDFYYELAILWHRKQPKEKEVMISRLERTMDSINGVNPVRSDLRKPIDNIWKQDRYTFETVLKGVLAGFEFFAKRECKEEMLSHQK